MYLRKCLGRLQGHGRLSLCITPICSPLFPLNYISFLPTADVVEAEVLDAEALLSLVKTPQPLTRHRPSLALPALATPERPQRSKWSDRKRGGGHRRKTELKVVPPLLSFSCFYTDSPSLQDTPATVGVFGRQTGLTVQVVSTFCHWTLLYLKMTKNWRSVLEYRFSWVN